MEDCACKTYIIFGLFCQIIGFPNGSNNYFIERIAEDDGNAGTLAHSVPTCKRSLGSISIETVVILDEEYISNMRARGHATNESLRELMALKWAGVQAEWSKSGTLGYDVTIDIKEIVFWETNPHWYTPSRLLDDTLRSVCSGTRWRRLWADFDHIHLFTGKSGTDVAGKAYTGDICVDGRKCAVSTDTSVAEYVITAHELGHCFGMGHDSDVGCGSNDGIMGRKTSGWSNCSVAAFKLLLSGHSSNCVRTTDVSQAKGITLEVGWPGMLYSDDEICAFNNGAGFRYKRTSHMCTGYRCINMNTSSVQYGVSFIHGNPTDGSNCGDKMVCSTQLVGWSFQCITWAETGLDLALFTKVTGGWSDWGPLTPCSRTCGTGVQYRQRVCDNPKPKNSVWCDGEEFAPELCNTQACVGDSSIESELIIQRAGETCTHWKTNSLFEAIGKHSANYTTTGGRYSNNDDDQCEVKCNTLTGYVAAHSERHGIMPDGTPCSPKALSSFVENNNLPRKSDMYGTCIQGYCYLFGCDNMFGDKQRDGCGVCGGDNSTCQIVEGRYDTVLASTERGSIVVLPAHALRIQFYFHYHTMKNHILEVRMKDSGTNVIHHQTLSTLDNPVSFAGTHWYFLRSKQYLYAHGPINQAVEIKLYNYRTARNTGVNYAYSLPLASDMATCAGSCQNGGVWNMSTCSCDCAHGFYGIHCTDTCSKFCQNSQPLAASRCKCNCRDNTYGKTCNCRYPFTGIDCQDCKITTCHNGGTFNATTCRCICKQEFGDLDCSSPCGDAILTQTCNAKVRRGHCESQNEAMERDCYKSCGLCGT